MEASLLATNTAITLSTLSKTPIISHLHRHFSITRPSQLAYALRLNRVYSSDVRSLNRFGSVSLSRGLGATVDLRGKCFGSSAAASFSSAGEGVTGKDGSGGGCCGGAKLSAAAAASPEAEDVSASSSDVIILDVGGMMCGGCSSSVKRILESQPQVSSASVNLTTETAVVWPVSEAKVEPNWQKQVGEALANHLSTCGFNSKIRGQEANEGDTSS